MKKLLFTFFMTTMAIGVIAQVKAIQDFHERFSDAGKYVAIHIEGGMLKLLSNIETEDQESEDLLKAISKLEGIDVYVVNKDDNQYDEDYIRDFKKTIRKEKFDDLMTVREGETKIDFLVKEKNGKISDLVMLIDENNEFVLLSFSGEIDLKALARLSEELDIKGAGHLDKIEEK